MDYTKNPYRNSENEKYDIWELLVRRDFDAFLKGDWGIIKDDFIEDDFFGLDCKYSDNPDNWCLTFPDLMTYRNEWERQSREFRKNKFAEDPRLALYRSVVLENISIKGGFASVHKYFNGEIALQEADDLKLKWVSIFLLKKFEGNWKIKGFTGYIRLHNDCKR
ncbi:hypothetical protein GCM10009122_56010 [Fulvivirga kasyanovii]|uniref:SnoaL-like domain-containing protein n=1 Tax=Fulvivirga kasyanovii TaxID=396812 RepID=A0ABW9RL16_9BACT|nr:hypothetical protein [Fulvivirga kasyanovii]MTI24625.1 hypothetical protein [Fulvivirga kasyanovii]